MEPRPQRTGKKPHEKAEGIAAAPKLRQPPPLSSNRANEKGMHERRRRVPANIFGLRVG